jgi:hypothetical protein
LQSALRLTVGFSNFTLNRNKSVISEPKFCHLNIKLKLSVSNFSLFITIHNVFVFVDSKSYVSVTNQN